jgi:hypothetical protein
MAYNFTIHALMHRGKRQKSRLGAKRALSMVLFALGIDQ